MYVSSSSALNTLTFKPVPVQQNPLPANSAVVSPYGQDAWSPTLTGDNTMQAQGKNVGLRLVGKTLGIKADYIEATFTDKTPANPIDIENADFNLQVHAGAVHISDVDATLTVEKLLNRSAANRGKSSPVKDLRIAFDANNQLRVEGKVKALGMALPFSVKGQVSAGQSGEIRYDLGQARVAGVPLKGLMAVTGLNLDKLLKLRDPSQGYYTTGNSLVVDLSRTISQLEDAPGMQASVRGLRTHLGQLELLVGDTPEDAARAEREKASREPAYVKATAGHAYVDGFFVRNGKLNIYDQTPGSPLNLNYVGPERNIQIKSGMIGITDARFEELIKDEIGESKDFTRINTSLTTRGAHLQGRLYDKIGVSMDLKFDRTSTGKLMFTPESPKALGFIPLPEGFVAGKIQKMVKTGSPIGNGVALDSMSGMDLGNIQQVQHQNGYMVISVAEKPVRY